MCRGEESRGYHEKTLSLTCRIVFLLLLTTSFVGRAHQVHSVSSDSTVTHDSVQSICIVGDTITEQRVTNSITDVVGKKPFYMDIRTNMLYDAVLLPNIGAEFYLGKNFTIGANWMYGWWSKNISHFYWRAYGAEIFGRWWFGRKAHQKPLTGLHLGVYGQYYMYDFELGGKGEMGGKPEDNLWAQGLYGAGVEFGYSLPVSKRLNIDFSLGIGYSGGTYHKYIPIDTHYVWQGTYHRNYIGPTKLEIALVWLIGHNNTNKRYASKVGMHPGASDSDNLVGTRYIASPESTQRKEVAND